MMTHLADKHINRTVPVQISKSYVSAHTKSFSPDFFPYNRFGIICLQPLLFGIIGQPTLVKCFERILGCGHLNAGKPGGRIGQESHFPN